MQIIFSPSRREQQLQLEKEGDVITINGTAYDFSHVAEGEEHQVPDEEAPWFSGPVSRKEGMLIVRLVLPHGANAPQDTRFPQPLIQIEDGPVAVPLWGSD